MDAAEKVSLAPKGLLSMYQDGGIGDFRVICSKMTFIDRSSLGRKLDHGTTQVQGISLMSPILVLCIISISTSDNHFCCDDDVVGRCNTKREIAHFPWHQVSNDRQGKYAAPEHAGGDEPYSY